MSLERIIITFNEDGSLRGIASYDKGELPKPLKLQDLAALAGTINTATLAAAAAKDDSDERVAALETKLAEVLAAAEKADPAELAEKVADAKRSEKEREIARLEKEKQRIEDELEKKRANTNTNGEKRNEL